MTKTIVANWKMNGSSAFAAEFAQGFSQFLGRSPIKSNVVICPPFTLLLQLFSAFQASGVAIGGQDCSANSAGAHTGDISASMLKDAGATHVILGHSERRQYHAETSATVRQKAEAAIAAGLTPIICIGESAEQRKAGNAEATVLTQLKESLPNPQILLAYEPIWAIGSGRTPSISEISAMHQAIKTAVPGASVLYGGSVNAANAGEILHAEGVDGALVGGASLKLEEFCAIVSAAEG